MRSRYRFSLSALRDDQSVFLIFTHAIDQRPFVFCGNKLEYDVHRGAADFESSYGGYTMVAGQLRVPHDVYLGRDALNRYCPI